jgi:hypothetical protein
MARIRTQLRRKKKLTSQIPTEGNHKMLGPVIWGPGASDEIFGTMSSTSLRQCVVYMLSHVYMRVTGRTILLALIRGMFMKLRHKAYYNII